MKFVFIIDKIIKNQLHKNDYKHCIVNIRTQELPLGYYFKKYDWLIINCKNFNY